jgi:hypothetical protein
MDSESASFSKDILLTSKKESQQTVDHSQIAKMLFFSAIKKESKVPATSNDYYDEGFTSRASLNP